MASSEKKAELAGVKEQIISQVSAALTGDFFGEPKRGYDSYSDVQFPHINFSLHFYGQGKRGLEFMGEVHWIASHSGGKFEDHSRCQLTYSRGGVLSSIQVPSSITRAGIYTLDAERFAQNISNALATS